MSRTQHATRIEGRTAPGAAALLSFALLLAPCHASAQDDALERAHAEVERKMTLAREGTLAPVDENHPDRGRTALPRSGGHLRVPLAKLPTHLNYMVSNQTYLAVIWDELHAFLGRPVGSWQEWKPELARGWRMEDVLVLRGKSTAANDRLPMANRAVGAVSSTGDSTGYRLRAFGEKGNGIDFSEEEVERVDRGAAITFFLRGDVRWHDGVPFTAEDVRFSWACLRNAEVDCSTVRSIYEQIVACEVLDRYTVRLVFERQNFQALLVACRMMILPRHLYERPGASAEEQGRLVNESPYNREFVGLGPYRLAEFEDSSYVKLERFDGWFGAEPYPDSITYRQIESPVTALRELRAGGLDLAENLSSRQYVLETENEDFQEAFVKDLTFAGSYQFLAWNGRRPELANVAIRRALAHCFDVQGFIDRIGRGLAVAVTCHQSVMGPAYNWNITPFPFDLERATRLFTEAGWFDRDGDGLIDDGNAPWAITLMVNTGNVAGRLIGAELQENLARIGARLEIEQVDWPTFQARRDNREFDALFMGWSRGPEGDLYQTWHGDLAAPGKRNSNFVSYANPEVDALIDEARLCLDEERRWALWRAAQQFIYHDQPYFFLYAGSNRLAWSQKWRGVRVYPGRPIVRLREWYLQYPPFARY